MPRRLLVCLCAAVAAGCGSKDPAPAPDAAFEVSGLFLRDTIAFDVVVKGFGADVVGELTKFGRLFGFAPVAKDENPAYVLRGELALVEIDPVTFEDQTVQYRLRLDAKLELARGATGPALEPFELPEYVTGAADKERARRDAVRDCATKLAQFIYYDGATLGDAEIRALCGDLLIESTEGRMYNDVIERLVAAGDRAVPFLIWNLNDSRKVALQGDLPRLYEKDADKVRVYHVANYALERIFGRVTTLTVDSSRQYRREVMEGWQLKWADRSAAYLRGDRLKAALKARAPAPAPAPGGKDARI
jgi:hypothetical protein